MQYRRTRMILRKEGFVMVVEHLDIAEVAGAFTGIAGSWLVALQDHRSRYGFLAYLVSNVAWVVFAAWHAHWFLLVQNLAFTGSSLLGLWRGRRVRQGRG